MLRYIFFGMVVRPLVLIVLGLNVRYRSRLPKNGPAIIVANHNSHLDTMVLMTLFPSRLLPRLKPVAAADYFLKNGLMAWFSTKIIGILPLDRTARNQDVHERLGGVYRALENKDLIILFPEGSRGESEKLSRFKKGFAIVAKRYPEVPVVPIFLHGLGKALPKGEKVLVPFFCDVFVGEPLDTSGHEDAIIAALERQMNEFAEEGDFPVWE